MIDEYYDSYRININENIEDLKKLIDLHNENASNAQFIYNCLSYLETFLTASLSLLMTILTILKSEDFIITILGSSFAFLITLTSKYKDFKKYNELSIKHSLASDSYYRIKQKLQQLLIAEQNNEKYFLILDDFFEIKKNSHLESVDCNFCL